MARAVQVFALVQNKARPLRIYDRLLGHRATFTDSTIPGSNGPIDVRIFAPVGRPAGRPIVMVHGLVPYGNRDGYLDAVANNLAELGYMVVVPTLPAETHYEMRPSDLTVIENVINWTARETGQKVSVIGASFGGGLAVSAALSPSVAGHVKLIFMLSGYYNMDSIARYYMHEPVYDPYGRRYQGDPPGPLMILSPYLAELVPSDELSALKQELEVLKSRRGLRVAERDLAVVRLSPNEQRDLDDLETVSTPEIRQRFIAMLARHRQDFEAMSPSAVIGNLNVPLYVLHGVSDTVLPAGEIEWMRKDLAGNPNAHILITPWVGHAAIGQPASLRQKLAVASFGAGILAKISRSAPIQ